MDVYHSLEDFASRPAGALLTIGNFDGVHAGHRAIVATARRHAQARGAAVVALTFEPHPLSVLAPQRAPARLTTPGEKLALLGAAGVAAAIVLRSDTALLATEADEFLSRIMHSVRPVMIVEGASFNFGRNRGGSIQTLQDWSRRGAFAVEIVGTTRCDALPDHPEVNSSAIRAALIRGEIEVASAMLGRPHRITGLVGRGAGRGAGIGVPTANLSDVPQLLPAEGVYVGVAQLADGRLARAALNIGPQPTFGDATQRVEAHVLDFDEDLRDRPLGLWLIGRLRGQVVFSNVDALVAQIRADLVTVREHPIDDAALAQSAALLPLDFTNTLQR